MHDRIPRIVILGGGFGGLYCALELERTLARTGRAHVTLVNRENFFLFTPLLHEVAASDLDVTHIVNPIRKLLRHVRFWNGDVAAIDVDRHVVHVTHATTPHAHELPYDHLVLALGSVTNLAGVPGLERAALTMKSLEDAIRLRSRLIENLEQADVETDAHHRAPLLSVVVVGGGFAGVETIAAVNDFLREALRFYPGIREDELRLVLVHGGDRVLPELGPELGAYAARQLSARGVEVRTNVHARACGDDALVLDDGTRLPCGVLVWTAGNAAHPLLAALPFANARGRIPAEPTLAVPGWPGVWALGDAAEVPDLHTGRLHPPTAQHALRQGRQLARSLEGALAGRAPTPFRFRALGQLASIGRRTGVARILGVNFSGFVAWWLWRSIYLAKLPRFEKKLRVMLDWTLDLIFTKDIVQFVTSRAAGPAAAGAPARAAGPAAPHDPHVSAPPAEAVGVGGPS
jgi:NADH dehydrogenase